MNDFILTKLQRKAVLARVGSYVAGQLEKMKREGVLYIEISQMTNLPPNRISEIVNTQKINDPGLTGILSGGVLTVDQIIKNIPDLTEKERAFLRGFEIHENKNAIGRRIVKLKEMGVDVLALLDKAIDENPQKK